jgi:hypothetical protein
MSTLFFVFGFACGVAFGIMSIIEIVSNTSIGKEPCRIVAEKKPASSHLIQWIPSHCLVCQEILPNLWQRSFLGITLFSGGVECGECRSQNIGKVSCK